MGALLDEALVGDPDRIALVGRNGRFTMGELDTEVNRAAGALAAFGIGQGDRVAMSLPNDVDIVIGYLAAMRLGAIWLGINRPLAAPEKAYMLGDAEVSVLLADPATAESLGPHRSDLVELRDVVVIDHDAATDR